MPVPTLHQPPGGAAPHLVDVTMFMSHFSGGVRRYLQEKQRWAEHHRCWRHTVVAPVKAAPGMVKVPGVPLPFSHGYRLVLRRNASARVLEGMRPDLIESGDPYRLAWATLDAARRLRIPALAFCHSHLEKLTEQALGKVAALGARRYMQRLYQQFDMVMAPSVWMCRQLEEMGVPHVERQPLGVDTDIFHPVRYRPDWPSSLGLPRSARILVYVGRFAAEKHLDTLAAAVDMLGPPYVLVAIGQGPKPPEGRRVMLLPFEGNPAALAGMIASADAFIHGGDQETFGLAALEAMACGLPLLARPQAGLAEIVNPQVGVPVQGDNAAAFAEAIEFLFACNPRSYGAAARRYAEQHDWRHIMPGIFSRYMRVLERRRAWA